MKNKRIIDFIEQFGVVEIITFVILLWLYLLKHYLLSMIVAFALGVAAAYFVDRLYVKKNPKTRFSYKRKKGFMSFVEKYGILEIIILMALIWARVAMLYVLSIVLAFAFGIALAYLLDRIRGIRQKR